MAEYYFTTPDPNYKLKGSRDPLGLQSVWKETAQHLVKYLSTVSVNLKDFQTLCFTYYFQNKNKEKEFEVDLNFFLRFEQACAYARYNAKTSKSSFNGKDRVSKLYPDYYKNNAFLISNDNMLLANQRNHGIWGKYIRPFRDMKMFEDAEFFNIYNKKLSASKVGNEIRTIIKKIEDNEKLFLTNNEIEIIYKLFSERTNEETELYKEYILKTKKKHLQNELYNVFSKNEGNIKFETLFELTDFLKNGSEDKLFLNVVTEIEHTEKLICPLNRMFRYMQLKPYGWKKDGNADNSILNDEFISRLKTPVEYNYFIKKEVKNELYKIFDTDNWKKAEKLVLRNTKVSEARKSIPWMSVENDEIKINSQDGGFYDEKNGGYIEGKTFDNFYLLTTYLNLFNEIERPNETHMITI